MSTRIQQALDGELPEALLSVAEQQELAAYRRAIAASVETVVAAAGPSPDVSAAVLARLGPAPADASVLADAAVAAAEAPARGGWRDRVAAVLQWLLMPQSVRLRPALVFGVVALVAGAFAVLPSAPAGAGDGELPRLLVQFRISTEDAREVALVGDFSGWEGRPLEEVSPGVWTTTIPLEPGLYDYAFVIDGERWQLDPLAPAVADGFGGANSRIAVLAPEAR